jgi:hypothetical protein
MWDLLKENLNFLSSMQVHEMHCLNLGKYNYSISSMGKLEYYIQIKDN